ncbi:YheC/D like ATP-grasp [Lentibacillus halodurans]|uniref:YheC/D like ATP-grasp n=1 Tax=Lentibacillus halodurans TaxID=237679 RepID=A0A1I1A341_9BACI|nr:YheC/YheD family protein [Lentibacillus halodurans]SFB32391.1 YheC/D like ATP-grasp [Lentibacillus halodurans]
MATLKEKQLPQTLHIIDTLIEAADHFSDLVKQKNLNQSIYIFSSIVDGFSAIEKTLAKTKSDEMKQNKESIERSIHFIAKQMEQGNFLKISEVIQFSLMPQFRELKRTFEACIPGEQATEPITIGVYSSRANPRIAYPEERINAYVEEAERQGVDLIFFSSEDVDFENKQINADIFKANEWQKMVSPFPDVINNIAPSSRIQQTRTERKLRRELPFTSFYVGNKFHLPKKLVKYRKYANLLVPFKMCRHENIIHEFMQENKIVVFKPIMGRRGENIFFVEKRGNRYSLLDHKKEQIIGQEKFNEWLHKVILKRKNSYLVQRYIHSRTKSDEPFHIRAHVQKNGDGSWQLTKIYPRVGSKKSNLSNIANEGRIEELGPFLEREFGGQGKEYEQKTLEIAIGLTRHLDHIHGLALDELGIDLTIDQNGRFWLHEVNNGPQTLFHEKERAANTVAYAAYIAKNGIVHTNELAERKPIKDQFESRYTNLTWVESTEQSRIGMLMQNNEPDELAVSCARTAHNESVDFFYFTPKDIDFDEMVIRGYFYENAKWIPKVVEYPDVIYDHLRMRGTKRYRIIYEELEEIPFTNELSVNSVSRSNIYDHLTDANDLKDVTIPYQKVSRVKDILHFVEQFGDVMLKPDRSASKDCYCISKSAIDHYMMSDEKKNKQYSEIGLTQHLREKIKKGSFVVQQHVKTLTTDGQSSNIRIHMMKDGNGEWSLVSSDPVLEHDGSSRTDNENNWLVQHYGEKCAENLKKQLPALSHKIVTVLERIHAEHFHVVTLDFTVDEKTDLRFVEADFDNRGIDDVKTAQHAIAYAVHLSEGQI